MKAFGYEKQKETLLEMEEVTLSCTIDELENLVKFIQDCKETFEKKSQKNLNYNSLEKNTVLMHYHFRDWVKVSDNNSDFIITVIS